MVQTNTESIRLWSCRAQWPCSQSTVSKVHQSMSGDGWVNSVMVSSPGEFHPEALAEPYVNVSVHTAPIIQPEKEQPMTSVRIDRDDV